MKKKERPALAYFCCLKSTGEKSLSEEGNVFVGKNR